MLEIHWPVVVHRWDEKGHYVPLTREDVRTYTYGAVANPVNDNQRPLRRIQLVFLSDKGGP